MNLYGRRQIVRSALQYHSCRKQNIVQLKKRTGAPQWQISFMLQPIRKYSEKLLSGVFITEYYTSKNLCVIHCQDFTGVSVCNSIVRIEVRQSMIGLFYSSHLTVGWIWSSKSIRQLTWNVSVSAFSPENINEIDIKKCKRSLVLLQLQCWRHH